MRDNAKPKEKYKFANIDEVLKKHNAVNKPEYGRYEIALRSYLFISVKFTNDRFLVKLMGYNQDTDIALLITDDANQVDIFIQAQKANV